MYVSDNIALHKPAMQSSTYVYPVSVVAANAVDGSTDGLIDNGHCSHTGRDNEPWWAVDLGARYYVFKIVITNRQDAAGNGTISMGFHTMLK